MNSKWIRDLVATGTMPPAGGSAVLADTNHRKGSRRPSHVLLNVEAVVGIHENRTTAIAFNRNGVLIQVSFLLKPPPQPSKVFVASDDLNPFVKPVILCSVDDFLLLRVNIGREPCHLSLKHSHDYYIYQASEYPSLGLLESPPEPVFQKEDVGLLPRPGGMVTVASLVDIGRDDVYQLQLFHTETSTWTTRMVSVEPPQWNPVPVPKRIPNYCDSLLRHCTCSVVTIGGEGGTIAWVDSWRSILLCEVLRPNHSLRGVPIPLPSRQMSLNEGLGVELDFGGHTRGVSFNRDKGCLMLVHLERNESPPPLNWASRGLYGQEVKVLDWEVTTWSNSKMSDSVEDWHKERSVQASNITIDARMLEGSGLPCRQPPRDHSNDQAAVATAQAQQLELHNLSVCQPTLCPNGADDIVYLVAREKYLHPKAWFLAVDMKEQGTLKHVAYIGEQGHRFCQRIYCLSRISKYTNPKVIRNKNKNKNKKPEMTLKSSATDPVSVDEKESNYQADAADAVE